VDKRIEDLQIDMQSAIHNEFMHLVNKILLLPNRQNDNSVEVDYGGRAAS
jgi:hypothetical protein